MTASALLTIFVLVGTFSLKSQTETTVFAPIGATWSNTGSKDIMTVTRDTLIGTHKASILDKQWTCGNYWQPEDTCSGILQEIWHNYVLMPEITYTEGAQVYQLIRDSFYLLYDFAAPLGTIQTIHAIERLESHHVVEFTVIIDQIEIIEIGGVKLRSYHISELSEFGASIYRFTGWITDRFGKEFYPFPYNSQDEDIFGFPFIAQCYEDSDIQNGSDPACFSSSTISSRNIIKLFPNPASSTLTINLPFIQRDASIQIHNNLGLLVKTYKDQGALSFQVPIHDLDAGYYFVSLEGTAITCPLLVLR